MSTIAGARKLSALYGVQDWLSTYEGDAGQLGDNPDDESIPADLRDGLTVLNEMIETLTREVGTAEIRRQFRKKYPDAGTSQIFAIARRQEPAVLRAASATAMQKVKR